MESVQFEILDGFLPATDRRLSTSFFFHLLSSSSLLYGNGFAERAFAVQSSKIIGNWEEGSIAW
jgi:hypothetical protein